MTYIFIFNASYVIEVLSSPFYNLGKFIDTILPTLVPNWTYKIIIASSLDLVTLFFFFAPLLLIYAFLRSSSFELHVFYHFFVFCFPSIAFLTFVINCQVSSVYISSSPLDSWSKSMVIFLIWPTIWSHCYLEFITQFQLPCYKTVSLDVVYFSFIIPHLIVGNSSL